MTGLTRKVYTLAIIRKEQNVLLGYKKRGFGKDKINGFGGKVERNESIKSAAIREVKEECGVDVSATLRKAGILEFTFEGESLLMEVHVFEADGFTGIPTESDEMRPEWYPISKLPFERMWPDDYLWYPVLLKGGCFKGACHFKGQNTLLNHTLNEVSQKEIDSI